MTKSYAVRIPEGEGLSNGGKAPLLSHLDIELTERCDNGCLHCYINRPAGDARARAREMPAALVRRILDEAASLGCLGVKFTGGEPLLREDFEDLYLHARRLGMRVALFTNAALVTPRLADLLKRIPPLEPVEVSLYGMTRKSYEAVTRRPGSHDRALAGLRLLKERGISLLAKMVSLPPNAGEEALFDAWAVAELGMDRAPSFGVKLNLHARGDAAKNRRIKRSRRSPDEALDVLARNPGEFVKDLKQFFMSQLEGRGDRLFSCGAGSGICAVDAYGVVQPCLLLRHPDTVVAFEKTGLRAALTDFFPEMRKRTAERREYLDRCARCLLHGFCEQCPAQSWMEHGVLDAPVEYLCDVAHTGARAIGLLRPGERGWEVDEARARIEAFSEERAAGLLLERQRNKRAGILRSAQKES
jgi:radical SAM protein with 4Fe4S-binding SPASM domain